MYPFLSWALHSHSHLPIYISEKSLVSFYKALSKKRKAIHPSSLHDFPKKSAFGTTISRGRGIMEKRKEKKKRRGNAWVGEAARGVMCFEPLNARSRHAGG